MRLWQVFSHCNVNWAVVLMPTHQRQHVDQVPFGFFAGAPGKHGVHEEINGNLQNKYFLL